MDFEALRGEGEGRWTFDEATMAADSRRLLVICMTLNFLGIQIEARPVSVNLSPGSSSNVT